jgi:hypothetical protein
MQLKDNTYRALEILRFLRRATPDDPWTAEELAVAIATGDARIADRMMRLYHLDETQEDNGRIHDTLREIIADRKKRNLGIPGLEAAKDTLRFLVGMHWIVTKKGAGCWLADRGRQVMLLEVLHACGEDASTWTCCRDRDPFKCPYRRVCRAYAFHKWLSDRTRAVLGSVSIESIASGTWCGNGPDISLAPTDSSAPGAGIRQNDRGPSEVPLREPRSPSKRKIYKRPT